MSSPQETFSQLSSSPIATKSIHDRRRSHSGDELSAHRTSPTLTRRPDPDSRERQRTMDVDSAMQLSRARTTSISHSPSNPRVAFMTGAPGTSSPRDEPEPLFPMISDAEDQAFREARGAPEMVSEPVIPTLSTEHDSALLSDPGPGDVSLEIPGLPMYQPNAYRANFDFSIMDAFAEDELKQAGPSSPSSRPANDLRRRLAELGHHASGLVKDTHATPPAVSPGEDDADAAIKRTPSRRLSHSTTPHPRKASRKLALFEGAVNAPPPSLLPIGSAAASNENFASGYGNGLPRYTDDRPYRFSFYSNAQAATIHARTLSELPGTGQTFEDLFLGKKTSTEDNIQSQIPPPPARQPSRTSAVDRPRHLTPGTPSKSTSRAATPPADYEGDTWWLDILSPTDSEMKMLSKVFSIHPLTTEDILMEETREKIELFRNYYFVCFRGFDQDSYSPTYLEPVNMYIIVFREGTLSFHFRATPHPQNVRRRIKQLRDYISVSSDWISYALIDDITDAFGPLIQSIEYEVDSIDELVLILKEAEQSDMLRRIGTCRKKVMGLLRLMGNKADVVKGLAKRCNENWSVAPKSDIGLYLSDIQDHLITMTQNLNHYEKILSRSHSNYLAQISIEMTDANNQINDVLSKLTALGTVLIPMNLVTGLWGMNVHVPGQDVDGYTWFVSIIGGLVGFALIGSFITYRMMVARR